MKKKENIYKFLYMQRYIQSQILNSYSMLNKLSNIWFKITSYIIS